MKIDSYNPYIGEKPISITQDSFKNMDKEKARKAAEGMEAEFYKIMFKAMKKTVPDNDEVKAPGKDIMNEFMLERFAEYMASKSSLGLADMVFDYVEEQEKHQKDVSEIE